MTILHKTSILELLSGIFGWIYWVSLFLNFYFLATAIFFDGAWWLLLYGMLLSGASYFLNRWFNIQKVRLYYVDELIKRGTPSEAAKGIWRLAYRNQVDTLEVITGGKLKLGRVFHPITGYQDNVFLLESIEGSEQGEADK